MTRLIIFLIATLCLFHGILGQTLHYDAFKKEHKVGEMDIAVKTVDDQKTFEVRSHMDFRFLISLKVRFDNTEIFKKGVLESGTVNNRMIGFKENRAVIHKKMNGYHLLINDSAVPVEADEISYTVAKIYTQEPQDGQEVYSPYYGEYFKFERVRPNTYKYSAPEGDNYYTYLEGVCTDIVVERDFATINFKLKPEVLAAVKSNAANFRSHD